MKNSFLTKNNLSTLALLLLVAGLFSLVMVNPAFASLADDAQKGVDAAGGPAESVSLADTIVKVINFMLFTVGILSVIMVIVGGIRFVVSAGDSNGVQGARSTIIYAIVGLVVAFVAWGMVNFVANLF